MIIQFTSEAERDLESIRDYIAQDNPRRAVSLVAEFRAKCMHLADFPLAFRLVPYYGCHEIRRRLHGNYLIFYRVNGDQIIILHLYGAMDYSPIRFS